MHRLLLIIGIVTLLFMCSVFSMKCRAHGGNAYYNRSMHSMLQQDAMTWTTFYTFESALSGKAKQLGITYKRQMRYGI
jgi:hypothetical protein